MDAADGVNSAGDSGSAGSLRTADTIVVEERVSERPLTRRELRERRLAEQAEVVAAADSIDISVETTSAPPAADGEPDTSTVTIPAVHSRGSDLSDAPVSFAPVSAGAPSTVSSAGPRARVVADAEFTLPPLAGASTASTIGNGSRNGSSPDASRVPQPVAAARLPASSGGHRDLPPADTRKGLRARVRSARSTLAIALVIPGLVGTFALPAYALAPTAYGTTDAIGQPVTRTSDGQSLTVAQTVAQADLARDTYDATSKADLSAAQKVASVALASGGVLTDYTAPSGAGWWRPAPGAITSPYGPRSLICNGVGCSNSFHEGIDFGGACGTPIKAASDGMVTFVGNAGAFGNRVIIKHNDTEETIYGHILSGSFQVAVGDVVKGGDVIAEIGATGVVSGCHLDLKVQINGEHTDPAAFLRSKGVVV